MSLDRSFDILIVGGGPAGLAATCCASDPHLRVGLVDDNPALGGQIWRKDACKPNSAGTTTVRLSQAHVSHVEVLTTTQIISQTEPGSLLAETNGEGRVLSYGTLILATGARELFLPFPGWTLPNVMGAGGLQALVKSGLPISGKRIAVAGSGPLLLAVAAYLRGQDADVCLITEQAPWSRLARFGLGLWRAPGKLGQTIGLRRELAEVPYKAGCWPVCAEGDSQLESMTFTDGRKTWSEPCDYLACGFGLIPNLELPAHLGCATTSGVVKVDAMQQTTIPHIYCAGEATGIGGVDLAQVEGRIAGLAAAGRRDEAHLLFKERARGQRFAHSLDRAFALRDELRALIRPDTIICRCEDVPAVKLARHASWTEAKLQARCGMGPCQGRICGPATQFLYGWTPTSVRPPIFPTDLGTLSRQTIDETTPVPKESAGHFLG
jgi:NADPH-dependent 2,4-dienoyl-CoA reductase/sulfur reductase-like enzyme